MAAQYCDPTVSRSKFDRQLEDFLSLRSDYEAKGWFLVDATFPQAFVIMTVPQTKPAAVLTGVLFDYTNYDAAPPSVCLVDPFTRRPFRNNELPTNLPKALPPQPLELAAGMNVQVQGAQPLMQAHSDEDVPFLCVAGTKEYHDHPGHSGDVWELHRTTGAGAMVRLLDVIYRYGVEPIRGYGVQLVPQVGFDIGPPNS